MRTTSPSFVVLGGKVALAGALLSLAYGSRCFTKPRPMPPAPERAIDEGALLARIGAHEADLEKMRAAMAGLEEARAFCARERERLRARIHQHTERLAAYEKVQTVGRTDVQSGYTEQLAETLLAERLAREQDKRLMTANESRGRVLDECVQHYRRRFDQIAVRLTAIRERFERARRAQADDVVPE